MASAGTKKALAIEHEDYIAALYNGRRSLSSGASVTDDGDVITDRELIECKGKFGERTGQKPVRSSILAQFEKIWDEACAQGRIPVLALRFYAPDSPCADMDGYVDLSARLALDDAYQSETTTRHEALCR